MAKPNPPEFEILSKPPQSDDSLLGPTQDPPDEDDEEEDEPQEKARLSNDDVEQIKTGIGALKFITWPGTESKRVCLRPLSRRETYLGAAQALQALEDVGLEKDDIFEEIQRADGSVQRVKWLDLAQRDEWLAIALRRADDPERPLFTSTDEMRRRLTSPEIGKLYEILADHMLNTVPLTMAEAMGNEEAWMEICNTLKKKPGEILLAALPPNMLRELILFMVEKFVT